MAIDSAAKRASALATSQPCLRLVVPDGSTDRAAALGMYNGFTSPPGVVESTVHGLTRPLVKPLVRGLVRPLTN